MKGYQKDVGFVIETIYFLFRLLASRSFSDPPYEASNDGQMVIARANLWKRD
jgi:hypothetical protein